MRKHIQPECFKSFPARGKAIVVCAVECLNCEGKGSNDSIFIEHFWVLRVQIASFTRSPFFRSMCSLSNLVAFQLLPVQAEGEAHWVTLLIQNAVSKILRVLRTLGFGEENGGKGGQSHASAGISFTEAFEAKYGGR